MRTAVAHLRSVSPYSQSRAHTEERKPKETADDHERRTWKHRLHTTPEGLVCIPPMAFKNCLSECAKFLSKQIPGKGKSTYTKHFEAGVLVTEPLLLPLTPDDVQGEWLFLNSDGVRGSGKRVWKCYPLITSWEGHVPFLVFDDTITEDVFREHLEEAGKFIGIGRFRPRNNGYYGRHIRRTSRTAASKLMVDCFEDFSAQPREVQHRVLAQQSLLGAIGLMAHPSTTKKVMLTAGETGKPLPLADTLKLMSGV